jgi:hypothetical protein
MLFIGNDFELWAGDVSWLIARSMIMAQYGIPPTEDHLNAQNLLAKELFTPNSGAILRP